MTKKELESLWKRERNLAPQETPKILARCHVCATTASWLIFIAAGGLRKTEQLSSGFQLNAYACQTHRDEVEKEYVEDIWPKQVAYYSGKQNLPVIAIKKFVRRRQL
jgi:hypothetical protein